MIEHPSGDVQTGSATAEAKSLNTKQNKIKRLTPGRTPVISRQAVHVTAASHIQLALNVHLPHGCHMTEGVTSKWQIFLFDKENGTRQSENYFEKIFEDTSILKLTFHHKIKRIFPISPLYKGLPLKSSFPELCPQRGGGAEEFLSKVFHHSSASIPQIIISLFFI